MRLAARFGNAVKQLVTPKLAYAFDLGVGGLLGVDDGFSIFVTVLICSAVILGLRMS